MSIKRGNLLGTINLEFDTSHMSCKRKNSILFKDEKR